MSRSHPLATSALGPRLAIVLMTALAATQAASARSGDGDAAAFAPLVDACVAGPTVETCGQVRAVIAECARELDHEGCSVLFENAKEVFEDPAARAASQAALAGTAEAIAAMTFPEAEDGDVDEATRADAERTLLRGDENLMSHSAPPLLDGDAPAPETR